MPPAPPFVQSVDPRVLAFEVPAVGFRLRHDLERLHAVRSVGATEAVAFYAARIWEAMTRQELRDFGYEPAESMRANQDLLVQCCNIPDSLDSWLKALRRLGNDARHVQVPLTSHDGELAFAIALRWLEWYFCRYPRKEDRVPSLLIHNQPLDGLLSPDLAALLNRLDQAGDVDDAFLQALRLDRPDSLVLVSPVLPAVLAEALIGRGRLDEARRVLDAAQAKFPSALRLDQLRGLYLSRLGRKSKDAAALEKARKTLERLRGVDSAAEEETLGILGGVLKAQADLVGDAALLRQSHQTYRRGWDRSLGQNNYLGVNAATTALLLDDRDTAAEIAGRVRANLEGVFAKMAAAPGGPVAVSFWDQVTLGEVLLLAGDHAAAKHWYQKAFREHPANTDEIRVARDQARRILERRGESDRAADVLGE